MRVYVSTKRALTRGACQAGASSSLRPECLLILHALYWDRFATGGGRRRAAVAFARWAGLAAFSAAGSGTWGWASGGAGGGATAPAGGTSLPSGHGARALPSAGACATDGPHSALSGARGAGSGGLGHDGRLGLRGHPGGKGPGTAGSCCRRMKAPAKHTFCVRLAQMLRA